MDVLMPKARPLPQGNDTISMLLRAGKHAFPLLHCAHLLVYPCVCELELLLVQAPLMLDLVCLHVWQMGVMRTV